MNLKWGVRLRVMSLLGLNADRLATETRNRSVRREDEEREERLGPQQGAIQNAQALASEMDAKSRALASG